MLTTLLCLATVVLAAEPTVSTSQIDVWRAARNALNPPRIPAEAVQRALTGEQVNGADTDGGPGRGWVLQKVDVSVEALWSSILDNRHQTDWFSVDESRVIGGSPTDRLTYQLLEIPVVVDRWWIVRQQLNGALYKSSNGKAWELSWKDYLEDDVLNASVHPPDSAHPVVGTEGAWFLVDLGESQTLLEYYCWTDIGGLVPQSVASRFATSAVTHHVDNVVTMAREHECSEPAVRPDGSVL